ncbi:MAG TPA: hypothetical protein DCP31_16245 [Cyanobacteria bacterium UBA8543]|nr:hypothetical protein [Cyanobacteria bacterium UBA8543]
MTHQPLTIIAYIKAKPGMEQQMQQDLLGLLAPTRTESGCITFDLLQDTQDSTTFVLYENWNDQAAVDAHFQQPYVKQVLKAYEETLAEPIAVMSLSKIEPSPSQNLPMSNLEVIEELYRSFREKDYATFRQLCTPDIAWIQNEGFPGGATRYGADAVIEGVFKAFNQDWDSWQFHIEEYLDAGCSVIVIGFYEGIHRTTHQSFRSPATHVYDLVNGKVAKFRQFTDTKVIWDAMS